MFKLLSKESNIFLIPIYIGVLLLMIMTFNIIDFSVIQGVSAGFAFLGIALGYFIFGKINLNRNTHAPLFLYTFFIFSFYPEDLDIGVAISLFTNSFLLLILTNSNEELRRKSYLLVGSILGINYLFLPTTWPMFFFVLIHIIATSEQVLLNMFRFIYGVGIVLFAYFCVMYFLGNTDFNMSYLPMPSDKFNHKWLPISYLTPVVLLLVYAILDHFKCYNKKSFSSRYKYTFLLIFFLVQSVTVVFYMGDYYQYLLFLALPASIILSRALMFMPKYWIKELSLWFIILSLLIFKLSNFYS